MTKAILIVEPDVQLLDQYERKLLSAFDVHRAVNAQHAIDVLDDRSKQVDLVLMDVTIDVNNGIEFIHELRSYDDWIDIPIVLLSSTPETRLPVDRLKRYGVEKFLYKPNSTPRDVLIHVNRVLSE